MVMHMSTRTGAGREGLGHESCYRAEAACKLAGHHPEEGEAVSRRQCVGIREVHLVLIVGVFMIALVDAPPELREPVA